MKTIIISILFLFYRKFENSSLKVKVIRKVKLSCILQQKW